MIHTKTRLIQSLSLTYDQRSSHSGFWEELTPWRGKLAANYFNTGLFMHNLFETWFQRAFFKTQTVYEFARTEMSTVYHNGTKLAYEADLMHVVDLVLEKHIYIPQTNHSSWTGALFVCIATRPTSSFAT